MTLVIITTIVVPTTSSRVGKLTFRISVRTSDRNSLAFVHQFIAWASILCPSQRLKDWQGRRDSNPQPPVLETGALPLELLPCTATPMSKRVWGRAARPLPSASNKALFPTRSLGDNVGDRAGADGAAPLADGEANALLHRDRRDQLDLQVHVVPRHHHLGAIRELRHTRHVRGAE